MGNRNAMAINSFIYKKRKYNEAYLMNEQIFTLFPFKYFSFRPK